MKSSIVSTLLAASAVSAASSCLSIVTEYSTTRLPFPSSSPEAPKTIETQTSSTFPDTTLKTISTTPTSEASRYIETEPVTAPVTPTSEVEPEITSSSTTSISEEPETTSSSTTSIPEEPKTTSSSTTSITTQEPETTSSSTTSISEEPETTSSSTTSITTQEPETTTTSSSSTSAATPTEFSFKATYLEKHNDLRSLMQDTKPLTWNDDVASLAQKWVDQYQCGAKYVASDDIYDNNYLGENFAYGFDFESAAAVTAWFNEITKYDWNYPFYEAATGHFTQVVWADTTQVGCGYKDCGLEYGYAIVCQYNPLGNVDYNDGKGTLFTENVHKPINSDTLKGV